MSESAPAAGERFTLNATVRNQGNGRSDSTRLRYYQSGDRTITTGDMEVGTDSVSGIGASGSGDESISLDAPSTPGTYYYGACVDSVSDEPDAANNCSPAVNVTVGAAPAPDLVVDAPTVSESAPAAGERFTLNATVRNQGNGRSDSTRLRYYQSGDSTITTGDMEVGTDSVSGIGASGSGDESISLTASSTPGTYYYGACVDSVSDESDTINNCSSAVTVTVGAAPAPDLVVDAPTVDTNAPAAGARIALSVRVRNQGDGRSDSTTLRYYQSTDPTITAGDTEVGTDYVSRLDAAESEDESVSLTAPSTPGAYYYGACVDSVSDESDTTNNCSPAVAVTVGAAPAPDLVVDTPTVSESTPVAGVSISLSATIRNQGNGPSAFTTLRYYQSSDPTITTGDTEVGTDSVSGLSPSGVSAESVSLDASSVPGTYYYGACVDSVSDESDAANNCSVAVTVTVGAAPAPDLIVEAPTVSESAPAAGARFTLNATVRNQGNGRSDSTTLRYYQSGDPTITPGDLEVGTDSVFRLDASESGDESTFLTAPSTPGTYYYGACVDSVSDESDTTNNCSPAVAVTVGAAPAPDLVVDTPTVSESTPVAGVSISLSATVRNQGNGSSAFTTLRYYQSSDSTITTGDTEVGTDSVFRLDASESGDESISLTAPSTPGTYYYGACVDAVSGESDTTNNCSAAVTVTVGAAPAPDLVVDVPTVDTSAPVAGARFTLNATVRNQGNGRSDSTTLHYYQSTDTTITTDDTEVGTDSVFRLNAAGSGDESIILTAPSTPGTYYYGACVEGVSGESDTTNNCSVTVAIIVGATPAPDLVVDTPVLSNTNPVPGASFPLSVTVRNQGNGEAVSTTLRYYRSTDSTITTADIMVGTSNVGGLPASDTSVASTVLPGLTIVGTYYFGACVDAVSGESDTTNNCSSAAVVTVTTPSSNPDLVVDMGGGTLTSIAGTRFNINLAVRNQGTGDSSVSTKLRYYRSTDSVITNGDTEIGTDTVGPLGGSNSYSRHSIDLIAPLTKGTYYYGACVDAVPGETNDANNCSSALTITINALGPDLFVTQVNVSTTDPIAGEDFWISIHVENQGDSRALSPTARFYRSTDATISTSDTEIGTVRLRHMEPSQRFDGGDIRTLEVAPSTAGTYYYGACLDPVDGESDTANNCSSAESITVVSASGSDLVIESFWIEDYPGLLPLYARVRNQGTGLAATTPVSFYLSTDATISTSDTRIDGQYVRRLAPSETGIAQVSTTAPSTPGTYYYGACVQAVSGETDTTNNCSSAVAFTVGGVPAPDLVVETPTVDSSSPAAGARFTLSATVRNQGSGSSAFTTLRYYQSTDSTITTGDTEVGTDSVSRLDASESGDESGSVTAPSTSGTYYYGACVEAVSDESDTTNNCSPAVTVTVGAAPAPDLVVDTPTVSDNAPTAGARFTLSAKVRNQGNGSSAFTTLRYYQSTDSTITAGDTEVGTDPVSRLDASESGDESVSLTAPPTPGTYYYGACVEAVSDESDTTNNCSSAVTVTVGAAPAPDLLVDTPTVSESAPAAGASFTLSATVRNQGNGSSDSTTLHYYQSTDSTITTSDTEVGMDSVSRLDASESGAESISLTAPSSPGAYYYGACVDAVSDESDTTNNCSSSVTVTVGAAPAPDLVVDAPTVSESAPAAGASFTLNATVRNQGSARSDSTTLRYYRSTDSTITTGDTEVGTDSVSGLAASGSGAGSISLTAPSTQGTYYYGACVEAASRELDTTNNCSSAVQVAVSTSTNGNRYSLGDALPGVPTSGTFIPAVSSGISLQSSGGNTTITFDNGGYIELQDGTRYTCESSGGCEVVNGEVTRGTIAGQATTTSSPDLVVDPPTVSESAPAAGASFTLNATVRNQGSGRSDSTTLHYYQSTDSTITAGDTEVGTDSVLGLAASGSGAESISPTAPSTPGTYYYGACVDAVSDESDTTNNCSSAVTVTVGAAPAPDLVVDPPTMSESAPTAGASFTLNATVRNQGGGSSSSTTLRYYQSTDSTITTGDTEVGMDSVGGLSAAGSGDESISLTAPDTPGTYYYGACVDAVSDESDATNNCSTSVTVTVGAAPTAPAPDLVVSQPSLASGARVIAGQSFALSAVVDNQGSAPSAGTTLRFYQSPDTTITTVDTEIGTASVLPLGAPGGTIPNIRPTAPSTAGTYYYGACVDAVSGESDTTNNCSTALTLIIGPDLVVDTPTVSNSSPAAGESFTLSTTVRNRGNMSSVPTTLRYIRSADSTITTSDTELGTDHVSNLSVTGGVPVQSVTLTAPSDPGTYYYGACVDSVTGESDTQDNCSAAVTVTVGGAPDLVVDTPTVSESAPAVGAQFTLNATVRNQGSASSGATTLRYYFSADSTISSSDTPVGTDQVDGLAASGVSAQSISLTTLGSPGTYYYGACVDSVTGENNAANNCSVAVTVDVQGTHDLVVDTPTVDTSALAAGARFTLSATVRNQGRGRSSYFTTLRYYQSVDSTITTADTELGTDVVNRLEPSESEDESITLTAPASPGTYYYGACVDSLSDEDDMSNNCSAAVKITLVTADLVVDTPTTTYSHPNAGTFFPVDVSVRNQGNLASEPTTLNFYRSTDSTITTSDEKIRSDSVSGLSPAETVSLRVSLKAPAQPGTYYYGACVVSVPNESNITNNCSPAVKIIVSQPDLVVETPWISHNNATAISYIDLHAVVRNQGTGHLPQFADFRVYLSTDSTVTADDTSESFFIWRPADMLSSSEGITVSLHVPRTAGEYYYYACVGRVIGESDTTNNCSAAVKVTVRPPDLTILLPTVSSYSTTAGESFTLNVTVLNQGDVRSADSSATIRYYRSIDATITSEDTLVLGGVGTDWVLVPNAHATTDRSTSLTAPSKTGTYYYGACVDAVSGESDTTNNCSEAVEVTVGARPLSLRLTSCFVFQEQHFVRFQVTANVDLSSVVVHTYQVEGRNNRLHLMATINVGNLEAGSSYSKLTSRLFPSGLRYYLTTCTASVEWDNGTVTPVYSPGQTTIPDLPPPPPTYTPPAYDPSELRTPTEGQVWDLFIAVGGTVYRHHQTCGYAGQPPCVWQDHIAWWSALPSGLQRCAFVGGCHFPQDPN